MLTNRLEPLNTRKWPKKCAVVKRPQHLRATFSFLILILFLIIFTNPPSNCEENRATTLVSTSLSPQYFLQNYFLLNTSSLCRKHTTILHNTTKNHHSTPFNETTQRQQQPPPKRSQMPFIYWKLFRDEQIERPHLFIAELNKASPLYLQKLKVTTINTRTLRNTTTHSGTTPQGDKLTLIINNNDSLALPVLIKTKKRRFVEHRRILELICPYKLGIDDILQY